MIFNRFFPIVKRVYFIFIILILTVVVSKRKHKKIGEMKNQNLGIIFIKGMKWKNVHFLRVFFENVCNLGHMNGGKLVNLHSTV